MSADRKDVLLRAAWDMLKKLSDDSDDALGTLAFYDAADCDGYCLKDDIAAELDLDDDTRPLRGSWTVKGDHPIGGRPDKVFHVQDQAETYAQTLRDAGFENVEIEPAT